MSDAKYEMTMTQQKLMRMLPTVAGEAFANVTTSQVIAELWKKGIPELQILKDLKELRAHLYALSFRDGEGVEDEPGQWDNLNWYRSSFGDLRFLRML